MIQYSTNSCKYSIQIGKEVKYKKNRLQTNKHRTTIYLNLSAKPNQTFYLPIIRSM